MVVIIRRAVSFVLLLNAIFLIVWAALPNPHQSVTQPISYAEARIPSGAQGATSTMMETRQAVLEWPNTMRIGEIEEITLIFEPVEGESSSQNLSSVLPDIYSIYNVMAEARFEVAGIRMNPANLTRKSMPAGQAVKFKWEISSDQVGSYKGTMWLSLRLLPLDGSRASEVPIYIHEVQLQTTSLFGMNETMVYIIGGVGIVLSMVIVYSDMIGFVRRRIKKLTSTYSKDAKVKE